MKKITSLLLACGLLTGCGLQFTYNQLDWLGSWYVRDYVSLTAPQKVEFKRRWNDQLDWHRSSELSRYAELLETFQTAINTGLDMQQLISLSDRVEVLYRATLTNLAPDLVYFAAQTSDQQARQLLDSMAEKNRKWEKKFVLPSSHKRARRRIDRTTDNIEEWTGRLSRAQRARINRWNQQLMPIARQMLAHRQKWHGLLEHYFDNRLTPAALADFGGPESATLADLITDPELLWSDDYRTGIEHNKQATLEMLLDIFSHLSARQMKHLNRKLNNTIEDLYELAGDTNSQLVQSTQSSRGNAHTTPASGG